MINFTKKIQEQFNKMCATGKLFRSSLTGQQVWDIYINSFESQNNPIFRDPDSTKHNCNLCNNFIRRYGNIIAIDKDYNIITMFDVNISEEYNLTAAAISKALKASKISDVFFETFDDLTSLPYEKCSRNSSNFKLGVDKNVKRYTKEEADKFGVVKPNEIRTFNHLHLSLPKDFVKFTKISIESVMGNYRDAKNVFQRTMIEIPLDTLKLVKDLITQNSLLDGQTHLRKVELITLKKEQYNLIPEEKKDNWCWVNSYNFPLAKFKNELIGVLCTELAEGKEINSACTNWNKRVDPINYHKATAPITKRQIKEAQKFVEENGYTESFNRRLATIDDIKVDEILYSNIGNDTVKSVSIFDTVKATSTRHKKAEFSKIEEVSIDKFMKDILPNCTSIEAFLSNKHENNLVTLTTANIKESKPIFKWSNNYSWTFNGNIAGKSQIKQAVKSVGGKVDGILRFSIMWNEDGKSIVDFDAHCTTPKRTEIFYRNKKDTYTGGWLDVDMIDPKGIGVENISWQDKSKMLDGDYYFYNKNFNNKDNSGFKAEIEMDGEIFSYELNGNIKGITKIAKVTLKDGIFSIEHYQKESSKSKQIYNLQTEEFHKVNLICLSPNHWGSNNTGNKHYFFMLKDCKCPVKLRSFHIENLIPELIQHRKVLEVLGNTTMIEPSEYQLSGLGFNATVKDELVVKLQGSFKRMIKIIF